jgi:hypothetical protein
VCVCLRVRWGFAIWLMISKCSNEDGLWYFSFNGTKYNMKKKTCRSNITIIHSLHLTNHFSNIQRHVGHDCASNGNVMHYFSQLNSPPSPVHQSHSTTTPSPQRKPTLVFISYPERDQLEPFRVSRSLKLEPTNEYRSRPTSQPQSRRKNNRQTAAAARLTSTKKVT